MGGGGATFSGMAQSAVLCLMPKQFFQRTFFGHWSVDYGGNDSSNFLLFFQNTIENLMNFFTLPEDVHLSE